LNFYPWLCVIEVSQEHVLIVAVVEEHNQGLAVEGYDYVLLGVEVDHVVVDVE
jgi:hypothetical protein